MSTSQPILKLIQPPSPQRSANELAAMAADGCTKSFDELQRIYWPRLLYVVQSRLSLDISDSEDICQESFVKAFQNIGQFDSRFQFSTWLFTIGLRTGKDFLRRHKSKRQFISFDELDSISAAQRATAADGIEVEEIWTAAKSVLSPEQYSAMWLRYGEGLSMLEVAKVLQRTQISVRVILHRARSRLMSSLTSEG